MSSTPIDHNDMLKGVIFTVLDITEHKHAQEEIKYLANLVENVSDAIISSDQKYIIKSWNQAAERIYGWKAKEVIGKSINEVTKIELPYHSTDELVESFFEKGKSITNFKE